MEGAPTTAMAVVTETGFGTVSSSLIALAEPGAEPPAVWLFSGGHPGEVPFGPLDLG